MSMQFLLSQQAGRKHGPGKEITVLQLDGHLKNYGKDVAPFLQAG